MSMQSWPSASSEGAPILLEEGDLVRRERVDSVLHLQDQRKLISEADAASARIDRDDHADSLALQCDCMALALAMETGATAGAQHPLSSY